MAQGEKRRKLYSVLITYKGEMHVVMRHANNEAHAERLGIIAVAKRLKMNPFILKQRLREAA